MMPIRNRISQKIIDSHYGFSISKKSISCKKMRRFDFQDTMIFFENQILFISGNTSVCRYLFSSFNLNSIWLSPLLINK